jgi:hypothetical protein
MALNVFLNTFSGSRTTVSHSLPREPFRYRSALETTLILANGVLYLVKLRAVGFCVAQSRVSLALYRIPSTTKHTDFLNNKNAALIKSKLLVGIESKLSNSPDKKHKTL